MRVSGRSNFVRFTERLLIFVIVVLLAWIIYLMLDLPVTYRAQNWDVAWIGFDLGMLVSLGATAWALWYRRQLAIPAAIISATFMVIDAWFDVVTSQAGFDLDAALLSAFLVELPLAAYLTYFARRAIRFSIINARRNAGLEVVTVSLIRTPLAFVDRGTSHRRADDDPAQDTTPEEA
ncbi:MAG: hypothetical protein HKL86_04165 [Acidimicrobiaceae bacterium]|nr:hypothetical protein [Acidimicrobiaceae bacterium]